MSQRNKADGNRRRLWCPPLAFSYAHTCILTNPPHTHTHTLGNYCLMWLATCTFKIYCGLLSDTDMHSLTQWSDMQTLTIYSHYSQCFSLLTVATKSYSRWLRTHSFRLKFCIYWSTNLQFPISPTTTWPSLSEDNFCRFSTGETTWASSFNLFHAKKSSAFIHVASNVRISFFKL